MTRRWHRVLMSELQDIWEAQKKAGILYNGCTHDALVERYGEANLRRGRRGWYKLVEGSRCQSSSN